MPVLASVRRVLPGFGGETIVLFSMLSVAMSFGVYTATKKLRLDKDLRIRTDN
ncbi:hypothetical protein HK102_007678, partial [Quaeritorhiza haematococci]